MSILDNERWKSLLQDNVVVDYVPRNLSSACYELSLGNEFFTTNTENEAKIFKEDGEQFTIEPGQFAILITKETINVPNDVLGFISIKFAIKFRGLINVSGFHVDPGFHGKLKFSVYNAGSRPVILDVGRPMFPLWFNELTRPLAKEDLYDGKHKNQTEITAEDVSQIQGKIYSTQVLHEEFKRLENVEIKRLDGKIETTFENLQGVQNTSIENLRGTLNTSIEAVSGKVSNVDVKKTILVTIGVAILLLLITTVVNVLLNSSSVDLWRNQGRFENRIDNISNGAANANLRIEALEKRLSQFEEKANVTNSTNKAILKGKGNQ